jgi:predicted GIY-YIG superfamily endonuclease
MAKLKWTLDALKASAAKYKTRNEWNKAEPNAYCSAKKRRLLDDVCPHMPKPKRWTTEKLQASASKYKTREEWAKADPAAYRTARVRKIMDEVAPHIPKLRRWTLDMLKASAAKYKTRQAWQLGDGGAYHTAHNRGVVDECCAHMERVGNRHNRAIYAFEFADKSVYVGLTHDVAKRKRQHLFKPTSKVMAAKLATSVPYVFRVLTDYLSVDEAARLEGEVLASYQAEGWASLNSSATGSLGTNEVKWTLDKLKASAAKYKTRGEWQKGEPRSYGAAHKHGLLDECCTHMKPVRKSWTLEKLKAAATKYGTRKEWRAAEPSAYSVAKYHGLLDECCAHMKPIRKSWNLERLKASAAKYQSRSAWERGDRGAYKAAHRRGLLDECCAHMPKRAKSNKI